MTSFHKNDAFWPAASKIFCAFALPMLPETPSYIGANTGIKTAVITQNDID